MAIKLLAVSLPLFVLSIAVISTVADEKGEPLITKVCGATEFPDFCTSALKSDPRSSSADVKGLSRIALEFSATKAKEAAGVASKLMQNSSGYVDWSKRTTCFDGYNSTADRIKGEGLKYFEEGNYKKAYQIVNLLTDDIKYCTSFGVPQLVETNTMLSKVISVVKTILHLLLKLPIM